jgi:Ca-activated chloride channel family protein
MVLLAIGLLTGCKPASQLKDTAAATPAPPPNALQLLFTYGSEKEEWVKAVTTDFNRQGIKTASGKPIFVKAVPKGSGELIDGLLNGTDQAHLASPASAAFIKLGNAQSRAKTGQDLIASTDNLVLSPVVIAMWQPMAEALGWGKKPVGWSDILTVAGSQKGWGDFGYSQWGRFKFGHTHPQFSNSGLISLFAEVYAATGKVANISAADIAKPETARYLDGIERSVVHYGSSTGFFGKKMFGNGPEFLSAAVLYENMVIESHSPKYQLPFPIVAIYPKEGTFWSDHPAGIVERPWVTPEHREAAKKYIAFLLERPQQERALEFGFRPSAVDVPLGAPIDLAHGVNPKEPQTTLEVPSADTMDAILRLWQDHKKRSNITLVFDVSGSMKDQNKIGSARNGALELLKSLSDADYFALMPFNQIILANDPPAELKSSRPRAEAKVKSLFADGGTALYDAVLAAYRGQMDRAASNAGKISAVVVLTDGADTNSVIKLPELLKQIRFDAEQHNIRIFTIGYGTDAQMDVLQKISDATQAKSYVGTPENIREVFKDISTFF